MSDYRVYASTDDLSHKEWLQLRRDGIGGSDAGTIMGLNPFSSRLALYADKVGESPLETKSTPAMEWGTRLEDVIAEHFAEENDRKTQNVNQILQNVNYRFMLANPDRRIVKQDEETPGIHEIKTTRARYASLWDNQMPPYVYAQIQHYMAVTGYQWGYVSVLIGKDDYRQYPIEKDDEFIAELIGEEEYFWKEYVEKNQPPPAGAGDADSDALEELYDDSGRVAEIDDNNIAKMIDTYHTLKESKDEIEEDLSAIENKVKEHMKDATKARVQTSDEEDDTTTVLWQKRSRQFPDKDKLQEDYPELFDGGDWNEDYCNESEWRHFQIY